MIKIQITVRQGIQTIFVFSFWKVVFNQNIFRLDFFLFSLKRSDNVYKESLSYFFP